MYLHDASILVSQDMQHVPEILVPDRDLIINVPAEVPSPMALRASDNRISANDEATDLTSLREGMRHACRNGLRYNQGCMCSVHTPEAGKLYSHRCG